MRGNQKKEILKTQKVLVKNYPDAQLSSHKILSLYNKANHHCNLLSNPIIKSRGVYIRHWILEEIEKNVIHKSTKRVKFDKTPKTNLSKAVISFFTLLPPETIQKHYETIYKLPFSKRKDYWEKHNLSSLKIQKAFKSLIKERVNLAKGSQYVNLSLNKYKIPSKDLVLFEKEIEKTISLCQKCCPHPKGLPTFEKTCFICKLKSFPFSSTQEALNTFISKHPDVKKVKNKIILTHTNEPSSFMYSKEKDRLLINLNKKNNKRHEIITLIHELSHIKDFLITTTKKSPYETGKYKAEYNTYKCEFSFWKEKDPNTLKAILAQELLTLQRTLFELSIYKNQNQNFPKLYAQITNQLFPNSNQKENPTYLLEIDSIERPFANLSHSIALNKVICSLNLHKN